MTYEFKPKGVCASNIKFDFDNGIVRNIEFTGGCNGNLKAISKILDGANASFILEKCRGNTCGAKSTSCADQLAAAVQKAIDSAAEK
ncbi:TIGR03905 family TSCPD domain-containing protein [Treponema sp.]|uniref:TIGR03905 family TSCPD domain-containing protein n=1 Tax=Treponema sp. TaxID=166 RepID=UPI003F0E3DC0